MRSVRAVEISFAGEESMPRERKALRTAISILFGSHATTSPLRRMTRQSGFSVLAPRELRRAFSVVLRRMRRLLATSWAFRRTRAISMMEVSSLDERRTVPSDSSVFALAVSISLTLRTMFATSWRLVSLKMSSCFRARARSVTARPTVSAIFAMLRSDCSSPT